MTKDTEKYNKIKEVSYR